MKKILFVLLICLIASPGVGETADSVCAKKTTAALAKAMDAQKVKADSLINLVKLQQAKTNCYDCSRKLSWSQKALVCLPLCFFTGLLVLISARLKTNGYRLDRALSEDMSIQELPNPAYDPARPDQAAATIKQPFFKPSASRLIAFLSGLAALSIAIGAVTYFLYMHFRTGVEPNLDKLFDILLALGIGVTPYAVSKVSTAMAPKQ